MKIFVGFYDSIKGDDVDPVLIDYTQQEIVVVSRKRETVYLALIEYLKKHHDGLDDEIDIDKIKDIKTKWMVFNDLAKQIDFPDGGYVQTSIHPFLIDSDSKDVYCVFEAEVDDYNDNHCDRDTTGSGNVIGVYSTEGEAHKRAYLRLIEWAADNFELEEDDEKVNRKVYRLYHKMTNLHGSWKEKHTKAIELVSDIEFAASYENPSRCFVTEVSKQKIV
jgi:hypothetical protein